jgi:hypothetical protein
MDAVRQTESARQTSVERVSAVMPAGLGEILADHERRYTAFERLTDATARARAIVAAAERAELELTRARG